MPQYIDQMKAVITGKVQSGIPLDKAFRHLRRGLFESAELWEKGADTKREIYAKQIDAVVAREIEFLDALADAERERAADVEALKNSGWQP